ncbi:MAG: hypothetical protein Q9196_004058 [Gyalolechia fulgens]
MASSIGNEINLATRSHHATLNQSILHFLPLALPPHTSSYCLYALGISHFYPIYSVFECVFRDRLSLDVAPSRIANILNRLHVPWLERASALERDSRLLLPLLRSGPGFSTGPRSEAFKRHVQLSLSQKPHLLFAYTWIFYMALFSGGRYVRSKFRAGFKSWMAALPAAQLEPHAGLTFWHFPGELDGEDLKLEYKNRVAALSVELTEEERADIVAESVQIMTYLIDVVQEVAEVVPPRAVALALEKPVDDQAGSHAPERGSNRHGIRS